MRSHVDGFELRLEFVQGVHGFGRELGKLNVRVFDRNCGHGHVGTPRRIRQQVVDLLLF